MNKERNKKELYDVLTALLFVSGIPTEIEKLTEILEVNEDEINNCVQTGNEENYSTVFHVQRSKRFLQLATQPQHSEYVNTWLQQDKEELSPPAKETLAVIAYKQPINRTQIEKIRGFDSRRVLHKLTQKGLIQKASTPENGDPRAYYYEVTLKFLEHFGLASLDDLHSRITDQKDDK